MDSDFSQPKEAPGRVASLIHSNVGPSSDAPHGALTETNSPLLSNCSDQSIDEPAKQEFLWYTHQYLNESARFADTKAAFGGTIAAALLGGLYRTKLHLAITQNSYTQWPLFAWLALFGGVFLVCAIILAIWTVLPRLGSTQSKGFVYWGNVAAHGKLELFQKSFHSQSARTLNDHLLHHIFDISCEVCIPKYRSVALCISALAIGGLLASAALILQQ